MCRDGHGATWLTALPAAIMVLAGILCAPAARADTCNNDGGTPVCVPEPLGNQPPPQPTSISINWRVPGVLQPYILMTFEGRIIASLPTTAGQNVGTITAKGMAPATTYAVLLCSANTQLVPLICTPQNAPILVATSAAAPPPPPVVPQISTYENDAYGIGIAWRSSQAYDAYNVRFAVGSGPDFPQVPINSGGTNGSWMLPADGYGTPALNTDQPYLFKVQGCSKSIFGNANGCSAWGTLSVAWNAAAVPGAWSAEQQGLGIGTSNRPALGVSNNLLFAAWKGVPNDTRMFWSMLAGGTGPNLAGARWNAEQQIAGAATSDGPLLADFNAHLYAAWKGVPGDNRVFWGRLDDARWFLGPPIPGAFTSNGASLAAFNGRLYAAWKGVPGDNRIFVSAFDGADWSNPEPVPGAFTSNTPSLAAYNGMLFMTWKGVPGDTRMFYAAMNATGAWTGVTIGVGVGTSDGPSLAVLGTRLFAGWKGVPGDTRMFWSSFDGARWTGERQGIGVGTSNGPSLAVLGGQMIAGWNGVPNDTRMFWSVFVPSGTVDGGQTTRSESTKRISKTR
jgi:hypothetical protein